MYQFKIQGESVCKSVMKQFPNGQKTAGKI